VPAFLQPAVWSAALCAAVLCVAGCSAPEDPQPEAAGKRLNSLVEQYFDEMLALDPLFATFIGEHRYDGQLANDISPPHIARRRELEERYLALARDMPLTSTNRTG
jgi:hypothetical protein